MHPVHKLVLFCSYRMLYRPKCACLNAPSPQGACKGSELRPCAAGLKKNARVGGGAGLDSFRSSIRLLGKHTRCFKENIAPGPNCQAPTLSGVHTMTDRRSVYLLRNHFNPTLDRHVIFRA